MKTLAAALLLALACPAFATGNHNPPPPTTPPASNNHNQQDQNQGQHQGQGQAQGQHQGQTAQGGNGTGIGVGIGQGGNSDATATGGRSNATGGDSRATGGQSQSDSSSQAHSGVQGSGNSQIDAGDYSSYESSFMVQPNLPGAAPALVAGGLLSMQAEPGCGPLQGKVRIPVRMLVKRKWVDVGFDEDLVPYRDANGNFQSFRYETLPDGTVLLIGNKVTSSGSVLGNASSSGIGLAGGNNVGAGQVSIGGGNGQQQIGMRHTLRECVNTVVQPKPKAAPARKAVKRKAVKRRAPEQCVPRAAKVCPAK